MKTGLARLASILVHPAVVMSAAAVYATRYTQQRWTALALVAAAIAAVMLYSLIKTKSGAWSHIDASQEHERSQLNVFGSLSLLGLSGTLALTGIHPAAVAAIGLSGVLLLVGHLLKSQLKLSLHVAFAAFATCIVWPDAGAFVALLAATFIVAWSRSVLGRHSKPEIMAGGALGFLCGVAFQAFIGCV